MRESLQLISKGRTYKSIFKIAIIVWNIAISSFYFGYCIVYCGTIPISTLKQVFDITIDDSIAQGLLNGCIPIGALIGALCSSLLISRFSRRKCLLIVNSFAFVVGALIFIENFYSLMFFRLCQGFCVGFYSAIAPLIIKELSPNQISGTLGSFVQLNVCIGVFTGCFFTYSLKKITGDDSCKQFWYLVFGLTEITVLVQTVILIFIFPYETPKYLLLKGDQENAKKLVQIIYKQQFVNDILNEKKIDINSFKIMKIQQNQSIISDNIQKNKKHNPITVIVAIHLAVMQQLSGVNAVAIYGGIIASKATSGELALLMPSLVNLEQVLATFVTSYLLTKFGRRVILLYGSLFEGIACCIITIGFFIQDSSPDGSQACVLTGLFLFMAVFGLSLGPVVWLYIPEIVQPQIVPYSTASNWISASLVIILFPIITDHALNGNPGVLFIFFTAWCIGSFIFNYFFVIQTKDKSEKAIREEYQNKKLC